MKRLVISPLLVSTFPTGAPVAFICRTTPYGFLGLFGLLGFLSFLGLLGFLDLLGPLGPLGHGCSPVEVSRNWLGTPRVFTRGGLAKLVGNPTGVHPWGSLQTG